MNKLIASMLLLVGFAFNAEAGFLIDPYVGYGSTTTEIDVLSQDNDESGTFMGARLGYSFLLFSAGLDYQMGDDDAYEQKNMSLFVGVDLPILLRAWAEYFINSDLEDNNNTDADFKDGFGVGVGFTGLPFVSVNLEIQNLNYELPALSNAEVKTASWLLSVSLPIDL